MFKRAKLKRFFVAMIVILLIFPNTTAFASTSRIQSAVEDVYLENQETYFIYSDSLETIPLYKEPSDDAPDILIEAPNPSKIQLLEDLESTDDKNREVEFLLVLFENEEGKEIEGYVNKDFIVDEEEMDKILSENAIENEKIDEAVEEDQNASEDEAAEEDQDASEDEAAEEVQDASEDEAVEEDQDASEDEATEEDQDASEDEATEEDQDASEDEATEEDQDASEDEATEEDQDASEDEATEEDQDASEDEATEEDQDASEDEATEEDQDASKDEAVEDSQNTSEEDAVEDDQNTSEEGAVEDNKNTSEEDAVEDDQNASNYKINEIQTFSVSPVLRGVALNNKTHVYQNRSTSSKELKSYSQGTILQYRSYNASWYQTTVYVNGKAHTGYIHKNHVENVTTSQINLQGIAKNNPTSVYKRASTNSDTWKTYSSGSLLNYKTFTSNWYQATVYVNGKAQIGYIHKNHVENADSNSSILQGVAKSSTTRVYKSTSTSSSTLKSYSSGSLLKYRSFTSNWYQTTVYVDGKAYTGYIHKDHVDTADSNPSNLRGVAKNSTTRVYKSTSTNSGTLKSYIAGSILQYRTFTSIWYQATVYVDGKAHTGYIRKNHVEDITSNQQTKTGYAFGSGSSMNVYTSPNTSSKVLKSYKNNSSIKYKTFSTSWYQATVYVNGKAHTGYIHKNDVSSTPVEPSVSHNSVAYNYTFKHMVDRQMAGTPKSDGAGRIAATRGEVEFFSNPNNFSRADQEYFQFLVLSNPGGFSAAEINQKILMGAGTLSSQGQAFITAAKQNNINEAYLIAHAMHETGNGKSTLAQGIPVDAKGNVTRNANGQIAKTSLTKHTVYNMYGYGAVDADPINGGAKYAFDRGWFTPEAAIIGGAGSINSYISRGQDTLYKMRWNPDNPGYPQYATHVRWATGQTKRIFDIYQMVDSYEAVYEIPTFKSMPNTGNVTASALNVRSGPGTNNSSVGSLANGSQVKIIGSNPNGWYQIESGNTKGWVSSMYINLIH